MPPHDEEVPNIQACCASCKFTYNMAFGYDCPRCHGTHIAWARLISESEYAQNRTLYGTVARNVLRDRLDEWAKEESVLKHTSRPSFRVTEYNWTLTEGEKLDIAELNRLHALEDTRTEAEPIG